MSRFLDALKILACVALLCFVIPIKLTDYSEVDQFNDYLKRFNKSYTNKTEYFIRLSTFQNSLNKINELNRNRSNGSALYGLTKFSDLTPNEFLDNHLQVDLSKAIVERNIQDSGEDNSKSDNSKSKERHKRYVTDIPLKIDWRETGFITDVKNQKNCGACWAFSVIENIETMNAIKSKKLEALSVQEMIDCAAYENDGCNGGDMCSLLTWMYERNISVVPEADYPLQLKNQQCKLEKNMNGIHISKYGCDSLVGEEEFLLKTLAFHGPVATAINALSWQHYLEGVVQYHCDGSLVLLNHAVQIVGYDLTAEIPHYIVRNSWGKDFGDKGYLYIAIGNNLCGLANEVTAVSV